MGCCCSYIEVRRLYTLIFANDLGEESALIVNIVSMNYKDCVTISDPYLYNASILLEKNSELYPRLMEDLKCKTNIFHLDIEQRQKVDSLGKVYKVRYLTSYEVVNREPVTVTILTSTKHSGYYDVHLSEDGINGMTNDCYSLVYFPPGIHEVSWRIDPSHSMIIEEI